MAEIALTLDEEQEVPDKDGPLSLGDILQDGINLATLLSDSELNRIGQLVIRDVEIDKKSREDWDKRSDKWLDVAMQVRQPKNTPWSNASNVKFPLLTTASIQFQARAYPAIVDGANLVKGRVLGPDPDGTKRARADRIGQHMTWQLLYRMPGWEEDTDKLLLMLPIMGTVIRKTFYDSIENANRSEMISVKDFIINYMAKSLDTAPRYTHVLHYYPYEVQEKVAADLWLDVRVQADNEAANDDDALVDFYEQHRTLDLDRDGHPEHYVVTTNTEGQVARIVPCFGPDDIVVGSPYGTMKLTELEEQAPDTPVNIVRIQRRQYFTKYGFLPAPDGSFYDIGFGSLLDDITQTVDTTINQMIDAGALQNAGGGFVGDGVQIRGGEMKFRLGEWKRVNVSGASLRDNVLPLPAAGPSTVLFSLLGMLIEAAKEITSVQDVMTGEGTTNQPATTTLALIEQGHKVMSGIFKRIHRAFGQELRILFRLNRDFLDDEEYFQLNDATPTNGQPQMGDNGGPPMGEQETGRIGREDYEDKDLDVVPVSDPNTVSDMQKMARAQALMTFMGNPLVNQVEMLRRVLEAMGQRDIKALMTVPPPPPDPKVLVDGAKLELEKEKVGAQVRASDAGAANVLMDAATKAQQLMLVDDAAAFAGAAHELGGDIDDGAMEDGGMGGMEEPTPNAGMVPNPDGLAGSLQEQLGAGEPVEPAGTGAGGPVGPASSDGLA